MQTISWNLAVYKWAWEVAGPDPKHTEISENPNVDLAWIALAPEEDGCIQNHIQH